MILWGHDTNQMATQTGLSLSFLKNLAGGFRKVSPATAKMINEKIGIPLSTMRPDIWEDK